MSTFDHVVLVVLSLAAIVLGYVDLRTGQALSKELDIALIMGGFAGGGLKIVLPNKGA